MQYRDLAHDTRLALTVWERAEGCPEKVLGGTTLRLFSKKGRLKTGRQLLKLWLGREADLSQPSGTPAKEPLEARGELGSAPHAGTCTHVAHGYMTGIGDAMMRLDEQHGRQSRLCTYPFKLMGKLL